MAGSWPAGNSMSTTGPVIWITLPVAPVGLVGASGAAVAMGVVASSGPASTVLDAGCDLDHLAGDVRLADLVVRQRQVVDQALGVLGRVLHRAHPARLLGRFRLEDRLVDPGRDVARQEPLEDGAGVGLEDELVAWDSLRVLGGDDRQDAIGLGALGEG